MTATTETVNWPGKSGRKYLYWVYKLPLNIRNDPGNYIFAKEISPGKWTPVYIGETKDLSERFDDHHKMPCIEQNGSTHIHVRVNKDGQRARRDEVANLIAEWHPPCNG